MPADVPTKVGITNAVPETVGLSSSALQRLAQWQRGMVAQQRLPCTHLIVARHGKIAYNYLTGYQSVEKGTPLTERSLHRMYSMTKPITSAALMMLVEQGKLLLSDPVHLYLGPKWKKKNMSVFVTGSYDGKDYDTTPCEHTVTVEMLLTHTSGISYAFDRDGIVNQLDKLYVDRLPGRGSLTGAGSLEGFCDALAELPLLFQPGTCWHYGFNTEVAAAHELLFRGRTGGWSDRRGNQRSEPRGILR